MIKNGIKFHVLIKRFLNTFIFAIVLASGASTNVYCQLCYDDECIDAMSQTTPVPGCCIATTAGMTTSYVGTYGCATLTGGNDVWITFMAPTSGYLNIDFVASPQPAGIGGIVNMVVFDSFSNSDNCATLNAGGIIAAVECFDALTPPTPINLNFVVAGERYFILVSSPPGQDPGEFEVCLSIDNIPATGGQDCVDGTSLCNKAPIFINTLGVAGDGAIGGEGSTEDVSLISGSTGGGLAGSCFGSNGPTDDDEVNSTWYKFTCGASGTLTMGIRPGNLNITCNTTINSDDYDWMLLDVTQTGGNFYSCNINNDPGTDSATIVACNWSPTRGLTGFGPSGSWAALGYTGTVDGGCQGGTTGDDFVQGAAAANPGAWSVTSPSIVCGRTYALLISNFTANSTAGFDLTWGGTSLFGVQAPAFTNPVASGSPACNIATTITAPLCSGSLIFSYRYLINWGDGTSTLATSTNVTHSYTASGTYTITMIVTDPLGCQNGYSYSMVIDCPLPVQLGNFTGFHDETKKLNKLDWYTYSETNSSHFIIESSPDAVNWKAIGTVPAAGYSNTTKYYHLNDPNYYKLTYYRLKQVDFDGSVYTYAPISIKADGKISTGGNMMQANIYPNPSDGMINITLPNDLPSYLVIYDMLGQQVFAETLQGSSQHTVNLQGLRKGTYIVSIESTAGSNLQKLILN